MTEKKIPQVERRLTRRFPLAIGFVLASCLAWTHPLSQFSINHFNTMEFSPGLVRIHTLIDIAEIPAFRELALIDSNGDSQLVQEEIGAFLERRVPQILSAILLTIDGKEVPLETDHKAIRFYPGLARVTCAQILVQFSAPLPPLSAPVNVSFRDHSFPENKKDFGQLRLRATGGLEIPLQLISRLDSRPAEIVAETDDTWLLASGDVSFTLVPGATAAGGETPVGFEYVDTLVSPTIIPPETVKPDEKTGGIPILRSDKTRALPEPQVAALEPRAIQSFPEVPGPGGAGPAISGQPQQSTIQRGERELGELIHRRELSPTMIVIALILAAFYGAGHALTPGHGKTIVAAYLVGSRGTVWHAVYLGLVVTLTHMGSVFIIGLVALQLQSSLIQGNLVPVMECISGLLIVVIGLYLFLSRYRSLIRMRTLASLGVEHGDHHHHHHDHPHPHSHASHTHSHQIPADASVWNLLVLGISGGMVPCPTAIVVLMVAIGVGRTAFGLMLIAAFSAGLATVLIVIGVLMVTAKHLLDRFSYSGRVIQILPVFSGALITFIGFWLTGYALVRAGIISVNL